MSAQPTPETLSAYLTSLGMEYAGDDAGGRVRIRANRRVRVDRAHVATPAIPPPGDSVLDIYGAQDAYLRQAAPRADLACECSDAACRDRLHPRITAAAYERPERDGEFAQKPHFRWVPNDWHAADCPWVLAEVAARETEAAAATGGEAEQLREERAGGPATPRRSDHVDVFVVRNAADPLIGEDDQDLTFLAGERLDARAPRESARRIARGYAAARSGHHDVRSTYLREVVSSYHRLKRENRETTERLRIERVERSYYEWFRVVGLYHLSAGDPKRIWSGGVRAIEDLGDRWSLRFWDDTQLGGFVESANLVLHKGALAAHPRGGYLHETIGLMVSGEARFLRAWFYGVIDLDAGRAPSRRLAADFGGNLELVHLAVPEPAR